MLRSTNRSLARPLLAALLAAATIPACAGEPTAPASGDAGALAAKRGGGSTTRTIAMAGDIGPLTTAGGDAVLAAVNASAPFKKLTLAGVAVTLNSANGDPEGCKQSGSTRTYSESFGANAGTWTGELVVWQGRTTGLSNFRFLGTRTVDGVVETVQFTSNDDDATQTASNGIVTLQFVSAPLGFGGQSTHFDVDAAGAPVLRCVALTITAAP